MKKKVCLIFYYIGIFFLFLHPINSGDFFHHLATGRDVLTNRSLPYTDTWSFTAYGKPWVAHSWGAGVLFFIIYSLLGAHGISILFAFVGVLSAFFLFLTLKNLSLPLSHNLIFVFLASAVISLRWPTRPEVLAPLFLIALVYILIKTKKTPPFLPVFFFLWGIVYGSSTFLGIALFAFYLITKRAFDQKNLAIFFLSIIASLLNGYGLNSFLYIFQIPRIAAFVGEWLPLHKTLNPQQLELVLFYQYIVLVYLLFVGLALVTLLYGLVKQRTIILEHVFFFGIALTIVAPFYTNRFINLSPLLAIPIIALLIQTLRKKTQYAVLFLCIVLAIVTTGIRLKIFSVGSGLEPHPFQTKATQFLKEKQIHGNIFASQEIGGFLVWELPKSKVFVDTRDDLYAPLGIFDELSKLAEGKIRIGSILNKYKTTIVVADIGSGIYKPLIYDPNWDLVYLTDGFFVMTRRALTKQYALRAFSAVDPLRIPPSKSGELTNAEEELRYMLTQDPTSDENKVRLLEVLLANGKPDKAETLLATIDFSGNFGSREPLIALESAIIQGKVALANHHCDRALLHFTNAEKLSLKKLIFFPDVRLSSSVDKYLGEYYLTCRRDTIKAREYFLKYRNSIHNPLEIRELQKILDQLNETS